jgi:hypothetical protein
MSNKLTSYPNLLPTGQMLQTRQSPAHTFLADIRLARCTLACFVSASVLRQKRFIKLTPGRVERLISENN